MNFLHRLIATVFALITATSFAQAPFDQSHKAFDDLLKKHVTLISNGNASQLSYAGVSRDHAALKVYLDALSAVPEAT
jgi:hypothetical protein